MVFLWVIVAASLLSRGVEGAEGVEGTCTRPSPRLVQNSTVIVSFLGSPDDLTSHSLSEVARVFRNRYHKRMRRLCDQMHRRILNVHASIYTRPSQFIKSHDISSYSLMLDVEYECYGKLCTDPNDGYRLFSQYPNGKQLRKRKKSYFNSINDLIQEHPGKDPCVCGRFDKATYRSPTTEGVRRLLTTYDFSDVPGVDIAQNVLEVLPKTCPGPDLFEAKFAVDIQGKVTKKELEIIAGTFTNSFNYYEGTVCRRQAKKLLQIDTTEPLHDTDGYGGGYHRELILSASYFFFVTGKCYGCVREYQLWRIGETNSLFNHR